MTRFNQNKSTIVFSADTVNKCGSVAFSETKREELATAVLSTFLSNDGKFYNSNEFTTLKNLATEMCKSDFEFVGKLAVYARTVFGLRSVSHLLVAVCARYVKGDYRMKNIINGVCKRPDDMTEILSVYNNLYGKPFPNSLKKGLALAFTKFDEYQMAKYKQEGKTFSLKDVLCISHATPATMGREFLYKKVLENTLETPRTWEVELSAKGANKREVWKSLLRANKVGHLALIRNLRNICEVMDSDLRDLVIDHLQNQEIVLRSKVFPFIYYNSYATIQREFPNQRMLLRAIEGALEISIKNFPVFKGKTLIAVDVSGSMDCAISDKSTVKAVDVATVLAAIADRVCEESAVIAFDTKLFIPKMTNSVMDNIERFPRNGGGTDITLPYRYVLEHSSENFDRIIVLSDNEHNSGWRSPDEIYKQIIKKNPKIWVHAIDLQGYGTQQVKGPRVNVISGWSEKVIDLMRIRESGTSSLIQEILETNI